MNPKERTIKTINHEEPDRVPNFATFTRAAAEKVAKHFGMEAVEEDSWLANRLSYTEILLKLGNDVVGVGPTRGVATLLRKDGIWVDEWGFEYRDVGFHREIVRRPLSEITNKKEIENYDFPDPYDCHRWQLAKKQIEKYKNDFAIFGILETTIFEMAWNLVGFEKFLADLAYREDYVSTLLDRIAEYHRICGQIMLDMGIDVLLLGDDFGTQEEMLISPSTWRKIFKPRYNELIAFFKKERPDIKIAYHSCGSIYPIIPELIEVGIDILNPIQPKARSMDLGKLKEKFGSYLCFWGGVDIQEVLPFGTPDEVRKEVKLRIEQASPGGGFIIAPAHDIQGDVPLENIFTYFQAVQEFGRYY